MQFRHESCLYSKAWVKFENFSSRVYICKTSGKLVILFDSKLLTLKCTSKQISMTSSSSLYFSMGWMSQWPNKWVTQWVTHKYNYLFQNMFSLLLSSFSLLSLFSIATNAAVTDNNCANGSVVCYFCDDFQVEQVGQTFKSKTHCVRT